MIPLTLFLTMFADTDMFQSLLYLLQDDKYYKLKAVDAKNVITSANSYATFISISAMLMSGFVFDILGRKWTLILCQIFGACITILFPLVAPSKIGFIVLRIIFQCIFVPIIGNPLVIDYVIVQGRGKATAMQNQGALAGNLLSVAALFTLTKNMKNYYFSFGIMAGIQLMAASILYCGVKEPDIMDSKAGRH